MKKILALILALVIAGSMFSISTFAAEDNSISDILSTAAVDALVDEEITDDETDGGEITDGDDETDPEEQPELKGIKFLEELKSRDEWALIVEERNAPSTDLYVKNDVVAVLDYSGGSPYQKIIIEDGTRHTYTMSFPYFRYDEELGDDASREALVESVMDSLFGDMVFVESFSEDDTYVEVYSSPTYGNLYFNFAGDEIKNIECPKTQEKIYFSYEVDSSAVKGPALAINLTPLINFYIRLINFFMGFYLGMMF